MSLKNISLDPFLLAQLYKTAMIPVARDPIVIPDSAAAQQQAAELPFLGGNKKHITLLIYDQNVPYLPDPLFDFLTKILGACNLSMDDIALVNKAPFADLTLTELYGQLLPEKIILMGAYFSNWPGQPLKKNQPEQLEGCPCLFTDSLLQMQGDAAAKKNFWQALQLFFDLKK